MRAEWTTGRGLTALVASAGLLPAQVLGPTGQPDPGHPDLYAWYAAWQGVNSVQTPVDGATVSRWNDLSPHSSDPERFAYKVETLGLDHAHSPYISDFVAAIASVSVLPLRRCGNQRQRTWYSVSRQRASDGHSPTGGQTRTRVTIL